MFKKYAILGYKTINIGDDIQSFVTSTLLNISYIVARDDYDLIYNYNTGELITNLEENIYLILYMTSSPREINPHPPFICSSQLLE